MPDYRIEKDSLGEVLVPKDALYGAQTQRAIENFPVSGIRFPRVFIRALGLVKRSCARVNLEEGLLAPRLAGAIIKASEEVIAGDLDDQFPLDIFQTGSGTSTNMNANEVIASRANEILSGERRCDGAVHPLDHVNKSQSSNDVIPSAIHVAALLLAEEILLPALGALRESLGRRSREFSDVVKTGRTHLMDAMPVTLGQEISGWEAQIANALERTREVMPQLACLAIGGTAVGTGINAPPGFGEKVAHDLAKMTGLPLRETLNHFAAQSSMDSVAELSGSLKVTASVLMKIANDLRLMNSGPASGLAEIRLPELQPGSSIMPGKVNPVVPESVRMVCCQVMGNDSVIAMANGLGDFQLNVMLPLIGHNILQSLTIIGNAARLLSGKVVDDFMVNEQFLASQILRNPLLATILSPLIGYEKAAEVVKRALAGGKTVREVTVDLGYLTEEEAEGIFEPRALTGPKPLRKSGTGNKGVSEKGHSSG